MTFIMTFIWDSDLLTSCSVIVTGQWIAQSTRVRKCCHVLGRSGKKKPPVQREREREDNRKLLLVF